MINVERVCQPRVNKSPGIGILHTPIEVNKEKDSLRDIEKGILFRNTGNLAREIKNTFLFLIFQKSLPNSIFDLKKKKKEAHNF